MIDAFSVPAWQLLLIVGGVLAISEIFVPGFVMLPIGIGFLLTAGVAAFTDQWVVLLACLAVFEAGTFWIFQKHLKKYQQKTKAYTGAEGMVGQEATVTELIPRGGLGYVKLYGDVWQARSVHGGEIPVGSRVIIAKTEGNKVCVELLS